MTYGIPALSHFGITRVHVFGGRLRKRERDNVQNTMKALLQSEDWATRFWCRAKLSTPEKAPLVLLR
jgi:hypothetical protein